MQDIITDKSCKKKFFFLDYRYTSKNFLFKLIILKCQVGNIALKDFQNMNTLLILYIPKKLCVFVVKKLNLTVSGRKIILIVMFEVLDVKQVRDKELSIIGLNQKKQIK